MSFMDIISADIKAAMLAKEKEKLAALRDIKAKLMIEATSGGDGEVTDAAAMKIVMKLHKQRVETYELFIAQGREDLAADELFQAKVIEAYLPQMMSEDEVTAAVKAKVAEVGATGPQDMGKVMGALTKELAGKAEGQMISKIVKEVLGSL